MHKVITAHPKFNVISGWLRKLLTEPWRALKSAATGISSPASLSIPERILIVQNSISHLVANTTITKVVLTNKWWYNTYRTSARTS